MRFGSLPVRGVQLAAIWAYSVSQPTFSLLQANPEFLVVRGSTRFEVLVFAMVLAFGPPLVVVGMESLLARVSLQGADAMHLLALLAFSLPLALQAIKALEPSSSELALLAAWLAAGFGVAVYARSRPARLFLSFSIALPVVGLIWFVSSVPLATDDAEAARVTLTSRPPIVMVVLDEFPASSLMTRRGEIDVIRYPNFARLARQGTWYPNATTVHDQTTAAVPAILTGKVVDSRALPTLARHPQNLFTLLGGSYDMRVHEEITNLCPRNHCPRSDGSLLERLPGLFEDTGLVLLHKVVPTSLAEGLPSIDYRWGRFIQRGRVLSARSPDDIDGVLASFIFPRDEPLEDFLSGLRQGESAGTFHYIHLMLPHVPWRFLPSGREYGLMWPDGLRKSEGEWEGTWVDDPWLALQAWQRHLLQVGYADAVMGRIITQLETAGLYDPALVIVTGDHGAAFRPAAPRRALSPGNVADIANVPMFVKYPRQQHGVVDGRAVQTIDLVPTIADVLGVRLPWRPDGSSLLQRGSIRQWIVVHSHDGVTIRAGLGEIRRGAFATVRRKARIFGEGRDSLYRVGSRTDLIGSAVRHSQARTGIRVGIADEQQLARVNTSSAFVPALITGVVEAGVVADGTEVAVAVNGRIRALTTCFVEQGRQIFRALVPESSFRQGSNRVDVYIVEGAAAPRLVHVGSGGGQ